MKAIIFDLNKVIITYEQADEKYKKLLGIKREEFWEDRENIFQEYIMGNINLDKFLLQMIQKTNLPETKLGIVKKLHYDGIILVEGMLDILENLSKSYVLILMAGEGTDSLEIKLDKFNLRKYFSKIYATSLQKMDKTNKEFYKLILKENNLKTEEVIFIDDRQKYLETAKELGIISIEFKDAKQLQEDLKFLLKN